MKIKPLLFAAAVALVWLPVGTANAGWVDDWGRWTGYGYSAGYHAPRPPASCGPHGPAGQPHGTQIRDGLDMLLPSSPWSTRYRYPAPPIAYPGGYPLP